MCAVFLALGLEESDEFWTAKVENRNAKKIWSGEDVANDLYLNDMYVND